MTADFSLYRDREQTRRAVDRNRDDWRTCWRGALQGVETAPVAASGARSGCAADLRHLRHLDRAVDRRLPISRGASWWAKLRDIPQDELDQLLAGKEEMCTNIDWAEVDKMVEDSPEPWDQDRMKQLRDQIRQICESADDDEVLEIANDMARAGIEQRAKTCKVWPHRWEETFTPVFEGDSHYWVARQGPSDECGIILISTLKRVDDDFLWTYETQKVVTNKEGEGLLISCSDYEEEKFVYGWRNTEHPVKCEYITFGLY